VSFTRYIWWYLCYHVAWPCDPDLRPFDHDITLHPRPTHQFGLSCGYRLLSYELLNLITFPWAVTVIAHASCHMTYHRGTKMIQIFEIPNPNLPIHFAIFRALCRRLSHVIGKNSVYPVVNATMFAANAQYHVTCARGPQNTRSHFFWPRTVYSLYNFYGATMTINGSFILEHPHVKAVFGRKKTVPSKSVPEMAVFRKFKSLNINFGHRTPKGTSLAGTTSFNAFFVKFRLGV